MCCNFCGIRIEWMHFLLHCSGCCNGYCFLFAEVDLLVHSPLLHSTFMWSICAYWLILNHFVWCVTDVLRISHLAPNSPILRLYTWCHLYETVAWMAAVKSVSVFLMMRISWIPLLNQFSWVCWIVIYDIN